MSSVSKSSNPVDASSNTFPVDTFNSQPTSTPSSLPYAATIAGTEKQSHVQVPEDSLDSERGITISPTMPRSLAEVEVSSEAIDSCFAQFVLLCRPSGVAC